MKRKMFFTVVSLLFLSFVLVACSSDSDSEESSGDKGGKTTVKVWAMGEEGKNLPDLAEGFEEENPDVKIEVQALPWDEAYKKFLTAVASGDGPDILQVDSAWVAQFASAGMFKDLSSYMEDHPNFAPENFFEGAAETMEYEDKVVGIPWYVDTRLMFYRSDLLADAGYDEAPETWDEFKEVAQKLADRGDKQYGAGIDASNINLPFVLAWQNGWQLDTSEEYANFDDPAFKEAFELLISFFDEGLAPTGKSMQPIVGFGKGVQPMMFSGPWTATVIPDQIPELEGKWDIALMPKQNDNHTSVIAGSQLSIFHDSENVEEALAFMSYLTEKESQVEWFKTNGNLPSVTDAWNDSALDDEMIDVFKEQMDNGQAIPQTEHWLSIIEASQRTVEKVKNGEASVEDGLADLQEEVKKIISD